MAESNSGVSALGGIKVVDFSRFLPGAYFGWLASDLGAEVIRVEHPRELAKQAQVSATSDLDEAAYLRRRAMPTYHRGKRSLMLNPGHAAAREALHALIATADVLVEDYRPGVFASMGYSYEEMAALNPRLIYCSVTLAGQTGPYAKRAGHDPVALSLAGALSRLNGQAVPGMPGLQVADTLAGAHASIAIFAALQARERTGRGQHVDVAMSDACMPLLMVTMGRVEDLAGLPPPDGSWHPKGGVWECGDGGYICTTDMETRYWARFCEVIGRPDYIALQHDRSRHAEMHDALAAIFLTRSRDEWAAIFEAADTQAMPVYSIAEALDDPHNQARGMVVDLPQGQGSVRQIGTPFHLSDTPGVAHDPAGKPGKDSAAVLAELGFDVDALRAAGAMDG